jgi:uncharacterized protein (DUF885 family)
VKLTDFGVVYEMEQVVGRDPVEYLLGAAFDLREFHATLRSDGTKPP